MDSQTTSDCIPFITKYVTSTVGSYWISNYTVDVYFSGNTVVCERDRQESCTQEIQVAVVEFDNTQVEVQSGTYNTNLNDDDFTINAVDRTKAFHVAYHYQSHTSGVYANFLSQSYMSTDTNLHFSRDLTGTMDGHYYVAEAQGTEFSVDSFDKNIDAASETVTLTLSDVDDAFLMGSWKNQSATNTTDQMSIAAEITNTTTATIWRDSGIDEAQYSGYAIEFSGQNETVQRGKITGQGATASQDVTINSLTVANSMPIHAGNQSYIVSGAFQGSDSPTTSLGDAQVQLTLPAQTTLRVKHDTTDGSADNDISWEIIEWDLGAGPAASRRVMIVS